MQSVIEHDSKIGKCVTVSPMCGLMGHVKIEDDCFFGAGAIVLPNLCVGKNSIVGAGTVVIKDVMTSTKVVGNPGRYI